MNRDFVEMLFALRETGADSLIVGAFAVAAHGHPRATGYLDLVPALKMLSGSFKHYRSLVPLFQTLLKKIFPCQTQCSRLVSHLLELIF